MIVLAENLWVTVRSDTGAIAADSVPSLPNPIKSADVPVSKQFALGSLSGFHFYWTAGSGLSATDTIDVVPYLYDGGSDVYLPLVNQSKVSLAPYDAVYVEAQHADRLVLLIPNVSFTASPSDLTIRAIGGK